GLPYVARPPLAGTRAIDSSMAARAAPRIAASREPGGTGSREPTPPPGPWPASSGPSALSAGRWPALDEDRRVDAASDPAQFSSA
ncbi:MAG TPA: hypothetical protein VJ351_05745, partial [Streptosporangiaceae bacterium]|nr:hypothetical protein [Streptosporangiaceae bacterium]